MWQSQVVETNTCGKKHGDTLDINDFNNLSRVLAQMGASGEIPRVKYVELYHDDHLVFGWEFVYQLRDGREVKTGHHITTGIHSEVRCDRFCLEPDEHIVSVEGRTGDLVDQITFETNKGRTFVGGGSGGGPQKPTVYGSNQVLIAFSAGFAGQLHNFRGHYLQHVY